MRREGGLPVAGKTDILDVQTTPRRIGEHGPEPPLQRAQGEAEFGPEGKDLAVGTIEGAPLPVGEEVHADGETERAPGHDRVDDGAGIPIQAMSFCGARS
jgi:hypothetical protein